MIVYGLLHQETPTFQLNLIKGTTREKEITAERLISKWRCTVINNNSHFKMGKLIFLMFLIKTMQPSRFTSSPKECAYIGAIFSQYLYMVTIYHALDSAHN